MYINKNEKRKNEIIKYCESFNGRRMNLNEFKDIVKLLILFIFDKSVIIKHFFNREERNFEDMIRVMEQGFNHDKPIDFKEKLTDERYPKGLTILDFIIEQFESYPGNIKFNNMDKIDRLLGLKTDDEEERILRERNTIANERTAMFTGLSIIISVISIIIAIHK
jgi:hypothetical protein